MEAMEWLTLEDLVKKCSSQRMKKSDQKFTRESRMGVNASTRQKSKASSIIVLEHRCLHVSAVSKSLVSVG